LELVVGLVEEAHDLSFLGAAGVCFSLVVLRPDRRNEARRHGSLGGVRQWIESVFDTLKGQLGLEHHGARTAHGVFTRVAQRLLALAAAVWRNWAINAPDKRSLIAYDH
jgi:hypothetical protein